MLASNVSVNLPPDTGEGATGLVGDVAGEAGGEGEGPRSGATLGHGQDVGVAVLRPSASCPRPVPKVHWYDWVLRMGAHDWTCLLTSPMAATLGCGTRLAVLGVADHVVRGAREPDELLNQIT